jgi:hypothetical protein
LTFVLRLAGCDADESARNWNKDPVRVTKRPEDDAAMMNHMPVRMAWR